MKRRYRVLLNLFSFGLLLIALYLNFIKKDGNDVFAPTVRQNKLSPSTTLVKPQGQQTEPYMPSDGTLVLR